MWKSVADKILSIVVLCSLSWHCHSQTRQYQFQRIDMERGLSHHTVNAIFRDSTGFTWFATSSGLNRFDGYSIKVFKNIPGDTTSLLVDDVRRVYEGPGGNMWLFTHSGNSVYNPRTEKFYRNTSVLLKNMGIEEGVITHILKDQEKNFWLVHYNQGLFFYNVAKGSAVRLVPDKNDTTSISSLNISRVEQDNAGNIWVIHQNGIFEKLDGKSLKVTYRNYELARRFKNNLYDYRITIDSDNDLWIWNDRNYGCFLFEHETFRITNFNDKSPRGKLSNSIINEIIQDDQGKMWIGTENGGVNLFDKRDFSVQYILSDENDARSLGENTVHSMYKDREGIVWLGSNKTGVAYYHPSIYRFEHYKHESNDSETLPFNDINAFAEDKDGNIWIGTNGGGLLHFNRRTKKFRQYLHDPNDRSSLCNNVVVSLLRDHDGYLWIGTYYGGLDKFDGKTFRHFVNDPSNPRTIGDDNVWEIFEDAEDNLWLGTLKGGVDVYQRDPQTFVHYRSGEVNSLHTDYAPAISQDPEGNIWIGTGYGLEILNRSTGRFAHYLNDPSNLNSISNNAILSILRDSRGLMWVGTHSGLNLYNRDHDNFSVFDERNGLAHSAILAMTEDADHNIWMSTPKGLSKLIISIAADGKYIFEFKNYGQSDGLIAGAFHENAALTASNGELFFGGSKGFNIFNPRDIKQDNTKPKVIFTDLEIFNQSVSVGEEINGNVVLSSSVTGLKHLELGPDNNVFSIQFASLNFFHPEKTLYKYQLRGFNKDWLDVDATGRKVTFTNLDPGDYVFRVRATNSDGIWSGEESVMHITILPPFWKSNIAFLIYAALIVVTLLIGRRLVVARERLKFDIQQERLSAQRMHELDVMKIRFFTNVSHEFRTPLTLIITPLEKLIAATSSAEDKKQFQLIHRNARRLLNLVNQLLDFRRMEVQELKLNSSEGDIIQFIRHLVYSFSDLSEKKSIGLSFSTSVNSIETLFDQDKVEKIIFNLLSNAFKFTPEHGKVVVDVSQVRDGDRSLLQIKVSDTGIGIPADKHQKIFERFFQSDVPDTMVNQGSGIGLSITQEFVKLHGGSIEVESEVGKGSTFTVLLPLQSIASVEEQVVVTDDVHDVLVEHDEDENPVTSKPSVLLVEDNDDFRFYLKDNLKSQYTIIEAVNGKQGFEKALSLLPDLVVSDVMMPELNGVDLCKKIRQDRTTSHIPVILLTARTAEEQKIEGFNAGASDYVTKPFSFEILQSRMKNLLQQREMVQKQFQKHLEIRVSDIEVTSLDEKLIQNAVKVVEENLGGKDFSVEEMSRMLGMSRVQLYKKLHSLTGKTPIEFIRFIRIKRAAQLLEKSQYTVSEIAYQVGFNNPKYFAKYFKDQYNVLPSVYAAEKRDKPKA